EVLARAANGARHARDDLTHAGLTVDHARLDLALGPTLLDAGLAEVLGHDDVRRQLRPSLGDLGAFHLEDHRAVGIGDDALPPLPDDLIVGMLVRVREGALEGQTFGLALGCAPARARAFSAARARAFSAARLDGPTLLSCLSRRRSTCHLSSVAHLGAHDTFWPVTTGGGRRAGWGGLGEQLVGHGVVLLFTTGLLWAAALSAGALLRAGLRDTGLRDTGPRDTGRRNAAAA